MIVVFYPRFQRSYNRLDRQIQKLPDERIAMFERDQFDPRLRTHELYGKSKGVWSFSVDAPYRILFVYFNRARDRVALIDIGTHRLYS